VRSASKLSKVWVRGEPSACINELGEQMVSAGVRANQQAIFNLKLSILIVCRCYIWHTNNLKRNLVELT
jgi:hypothetical protein